MKYREWISRQEIHPARMARIPFTITPALRVRVGDAEVSLSPRQAFTAAERSIRGATRRAMIEETDALDRPTFPRAARPKVRA